MQKKRVALALLSLLAQPTLADASIAPSDQAVANIKPIPTLSTAEIRRAKQLYETIKPVAAHERNVIDQMVAHSQSAEFQREQRIWREQINELLGTKKWVPEGQDSGKTLPYSEKPVLFISSSIPLPVLRRYAQDLEKTDGVMVMRGFIGGIKDPKPTMQFIASVLRKDPRCSGTSCEMTNTPFLIDPVLFREYRVQQVPSFTIHNKTNLTSYCDNAGTLRTNTSMTVGDGELKYLIKRIQRSNKTKDYSGIINRLQ